MTRVFLGLGSNLGDRARLLGDALRTLDGQVVAVSDVYRTAPVGGPSGQQDFLNLVVELATDLTPKELLAVCQRLESAAERVRVERWGPRTLDVDVLWIDGYRSDDPDLTVPHPRMFQRRFVLAPLQELAPDLVDDVLVQQATGSVERLGRLGSLTD